MHPFRPFRAAPVSACPVTRRHHTRGLDNQCSAPLRCRSSPRCRLHLVSRMRLLLAVHIPLHIHLHSPAPFHVRSRPFHLSRFPQARDETVTQLRDPKDL